MEGEGEDRSQARPQTLAAFLDHFLANHRADNFLCVKQGNYKVTEDEFVGEVTDWTLQYLHYMSCPAHLEADITRVVLDETKNRCLNNGVPLNQDDDERDGGTNYGVERSASCDQLNNTENTQGRGFGSKAAFKSMRLLKDVTTTMNEVCKRLKVDPSGMVIKNGRVVPSCVAAIKNGRRKMEDRHVVLHDLNVMFSGILPKLSTEPPLSFYAVYDGHAGKDAAAYAASNIHEKILSSKHYPDDTVLAIKEAFVKTDEVFREKSTPELPLKSGTTAVCSLIRGNTLYSAWLGDSQAVLVRNGKPVHIIEPHKPNRPDEKSRIEQLGGSVIYWGTWRVNGQLAVSRAIGDQDYKPYVTSEPDVTTVEMNGSEDFIIIACDGLWDTVTPEQATRTVFQQIRENKDNLDLVSHRLVNLAKEQGSTDNITIVVVFLKPVEELLSYPDETDGPSAADADINFQGIRSTCAFIDNRQDPYQNMNGSTEDLAQATNPFAGPMDDGHESQNGSASNHFFDSPSGGNMFSDSPNPFSDASAKLSNEDMDVLAKDMQFERASPSMFEQSFDSEDSNRPTEDASAKAMHHHAASSGGGTADEQDFMANQENAWINQSHPYLVGKGDSGFISPAGTSNNHSASSEDSTENHAEREQSPESEAKAGAGQPNVDEEEEAESMEVTKLLASAGGAKLDELLKSSREETPTPPMEENDTTLEDILAKAREQPASLTSEVVEDEEAEDSEDSESDNPDPPSSRPPDAPEDIVAEVAASDEESSSEDNGEGFTFLKETASSEREAKSLEDFPPPTSEPPRPPESSEDPFDPFCDPKDETSNTDLLAGSEDPFSAAPAPVVEEIVEVAASTLNVVDEDPEDSAPSSLESQTGPASVIVESQEVPNPDQASFIVKTSDDLLSLQEPVIEVIPTEVNSNPSPIIEEQDETNTMTTTSTGFSESLNGFEAPRTNSQSDMFDETHDSLGGHLPAQDDSSADTHEDQPPLVEEHSEVEFDHPQSSDFMLKTTSDDHSQNNHVDLLSEDQTQTLAASPQSPVPTLIVTESTPQKRDEEKDEDEDEEKDEDEEEDGFHIQETPDKTMEMSPEVETSPEVDEAEDTSIVEPPAAAEFPILGRTVSTEAVMDEPLATEIRHEEVRVPVEEPMLTEKHIDPLCDPDLSEEDVIIKSEPAEIDEVPEEADPAPEDATPCDEGTPVAAEEAEPIQEETKELELSQEEPAEAGEASPEVAPADPNPIKEEEAPEETPQVEDEAPQVGEEAPQAEEAEAKEEGEDHTEEAIAVAVVAGTAVTAAALATTLLTDDKAVKGPKVEAKKKAADTKTKAKANAPLRQPNTRTPTTARPTASKTATTGARPASATATKTTKPATNKPALGAAKRPVGASTAPKTAPVKTEVKKPTRPTSASTTAARPGSAPRPTVSRVTPTARPTPAEARKPLASKVTPTSSTTRTTAARTAAPTAARTTASTRPAGSAGTATSRVGSTRPAGTNGTTASTTARKPLSNGTAAKPAAARNPVAAARAAASARPASAGSAKPGVPRASTVPKPATTTARVPPKTTTRTAAGAKPAPSTTRAPITRPGAKPASSARGVASKIGSKPGSIKKEVVAPSADGTVQPPVVEGETPVTTTEEGVDATPPPVDQEASPAPIESDL